MVSYARTDQIALCAEVAHSFVLDNGAYSIWKGSGTTPDWRGYMELVKEWRRHPGFDWAIAPDVIDGNEKENDELLGWFWGFRFLPNEIVPVWHMHESLDRLGRLVNDWPRVAIGSSGDWSEPGTLRWWQRISEAMSVACDQHGRPKAKLHGLRQSDPTLFSHIPYASTDSAHTAINVGLDQKWSGSYQPLTKAMRALVLRDRIEHHASAARWTNSSGVQKNLELVG
jgi:hypothetical protein